MRFPLVSVRFLSVSVRFPGFRQRHFIGARRNVRDFIVDARSDASVMPGWRLKRLVGGSPVFYIFIIFDAQSIRNEKHRVFGKT